MKLNKQQILRIRDFVSSHGIVYYDVQLEIIDHIACKVEELMTADPYLTFDEAIAQTHHSFGEAGFKVMEDTMRKSLQKRYWRLLRDTFLSYFKPVYLPLEVGFIYLIYLLAIKTNSVDISIDITWITLLLLFLIQVIYRFRDKQKLAKKYKRRMLAMQRGVIVASVVNIPLQLFIWVFLYGRTSYLFETTINAIICGVFLVFLMVSFFTVRQLKKAVFNNCQKLEEQYQITIGG